MTKTVIPVLAIWAAALGSAGALAYTVNRPPKPVAQIAEIIPSSPPPSSIVDTSRLPAPAVDRVEPSPLVVVGKVHHARPPSAAPRVRELSEMRCTTWTGMIQGTPQMVRRCE